MGGGHEHEEPTLELQAEGTELHDLFLSASVSFCDPDQDTSCRGPRFPHLSPIPLFCCDNQIGCYERIRWRQGEGLVVPAPGSSTLQSLACRDWPRAGVSVWVSACLHSWASNTGRFWACREALLGLVGSRCTAGGQLVCGKQLMCP